MPAKPLHFTVVGVENGRVNLKIGEVTVSVSRAELPEGVKAGDELAADFYFAADAKKRSENLAKALLEEILGKSGSK